MSIQLIISEKKSKNLGNEVTGYLVFDHSMLPGVEVCVVDDCSFDELINFRKENLKILVI